MKTLLFFLALGFCFLGIPGYVGAIPPVPPSSSSATEFPYVPDGDPSEGQIVVFDSDGHAVNSSTLTVDIPLATYNMLVGGADGNATSSRIYGVLYLGAPDVCGTATTRNTTSTNITYGHCKFSNSVESNNYIEWFVLVPDDLDTGVNPTAKFHFSLNGADTNDHDYIISMCTAAVSNPQNCTPSNDILLAYTPDASGASGDMESTAETTLTGWGSALTNGRIWRIRVTRDGDDSTNDSSTVDSYDYILAVKYALKPGS